MKSWKNRWQDELDAVIPALREDVKNAPIEGKATFEKTIEHSVPSEKPWYMQLISTPRRIASCLSACAIALIAVGASLYFALRPDAPLTASAEVISVEVNPQAVFSVDENGIVTAVVAANSDADVVLSENRDAEMEGKTVAAAVEIFVDYTAKLGYLDLSVPDAVRITSCTENNRLSDVGATLENYFCEKGAYIAVAKETLSVEEFCARVGFAVEEGVETLFESVQRIPVLFFEREAAGKENEELQTMYRENVSLEDVGTSFRKTLQDNVKKIEENAADLKEIAELNEQISYHEDNPTRFFLFGSDYWTLDSSDRQEEYTETFAALMKEMKNLLSDYETKYGVRLSTKADFDEAEEDCQNLPLDTLYDVISNFTLDIFSSYASALIDLLQNVGIDMSWISDLYELPTTVENYIEKVETYVENRFETLYETNIGKYETERAAIDKTDYESHLADLIEKYGSLSAYFDGK